MDGALKALIAATCLAIIATCGYFGWREFRGNFAQEARKEALAKKLEDTNAERDRRRTTELSRDGCRARVGELLAVHQSGSITAVSDVAPGLAHDIGLCIRGGILYPFEKRELQENSLTDIFKDS
ncbi:hypothetical protein G6M04_16440 [Agrobacterium rhizogenes]|uniref:hypothetical protein n=1 Tax=Rhizobium rhizogenes TaxID=359 RepID=UPI001574B185|nr:hypothetical protein [Rhizobium rhizogenes]NTG48967.1 hypothetical protein [Rhizobium rhizogenes]